MGAGLVAFFGAELRSGFDLVAEATGFGERVAAAGLVLTGEGRIDEGTVADKVPAGVARLARAAGVPCFAVAGDITVPHDVLIELGFTSAIALPSRPDDRGATDAFEAVVTSTIALLRAQGPPV